MRKLGHTKFVCLSAAGVLAAGCALAVAGVSQASASTEKPTVVGGLTVKPGSITTDGVSLSWDRSARAGTYRLVIVNASTPAAAAAYDSGYTLHGTSDSISGLKAGTAYEARVDAQNGGGDCSWSGWVPFYTTAAPGDPGKDGTNGKDGAAGPAGPAGPAGAQGPSGVVATGTTQLLTDASPTSTGTPVSVTTGGSFGGHKSTLATVALKAGTYLINVNFKATPNATATGDVFPQLFVYNGTPAADFSNDVFNIGSGALATYNTSNTNDQVDSYYSGSTVITVPGGGTTLNVFAFGYDSDHGGGSYELDSASLSATQLNVASS